MGMPLAVCPAAPGRVAVRALILGLLLLLGGCSAVQFAYNHADTVARYKASEYVDLDNAQSQQFQIRFAGLQQWHRTRELPAYMQLARQAADRLARGLNHADVAWAIDQGRGHYRVLMARAARDAAPVLATLNDRQLQQIESRFADNNRKYRREWLEGDERALRRKRVEQLEDYAREFVGRLTDGQRERIARFADEHARMQAARLEDRRRSQGQGLGLLRGERDPAQLGERLAQLLGSPDELRAADYQQAVAQYEQRLAELVVDLDRMLTPEQRARAVRRLNAYAEDFGALGRPAEAQPVRPGAG